MLTKDGYQKLVTELNELRQKRDKLVTALEEVAQPDETGEDGLATQLKEELEVVSNKIDELEEVVEGAKIITNTSITKDTVNIGCKVKIAISQDTHKEFELVSELEANPALNKISDRSPLGQALLGRKINEEFDVEAPVGKITYKVVAIS